MFLKVHSCTSSRQINHKFFQGIKIAERDQIINFILQDFTQCHISDFFAGEIFEWITQITSLSKDSSNVFRNCGVNEISGKRRHDCFHFSKISFTECL